MRRDEERLCLVKFDSTLEIRFTAEEELASNWSKNPRMKFREGNAGLRNGVYGGEKNYSVAYSVCANKPSREEKEFAERGNKGGRASETRFRTRVGRERVLDVRADVGAAFPSSARSCSEIDRRRADNGDSSSN